MKRLNNRSRYYFRKNRAKIGRDSIYIEDKNPKHSDFFMNDEEKKYVKELILNNRSLIKYFDKKYITNEIYLAAFDIDHHTIIHFPKNNSELFKESILLRAIKFNTILIKYIPEEYITPRVAFEVFNMDSKHIEHHGRFNPEVFAENILLKAIEYNTSVIKSIPEKYITDKVYLTAFEKNRNIIKYFPKDRAELFNEDIILKAIEDDLFAILNYMPYEYITDKIRERLIIKIERR